MNLECSNFDFSHQLSILISIYKLTHTHALGHKNNDKNVILILLYTSPSLLGIKAYSSLIMRVTNSHICLHFILLLVINKSSQMLFQPFLFVFFSLFNIKAISKTQMKKIGKIVSNKWRQKENLHCIVF